MYTKGHYILALEQCEALSYNTLVISHTIHVDTSELNHPTS